MFNRYLYEKLQTEKNEKRRMSQVEDELKIKRKSLIEKSVNNYKSKVKNFLIDLACHPVQLGTYKPPLHSILRNTENNDILGTPKMIINGYKNAKQRTDIAQNSNKVLDYTPTKVLFRNQSFRERNQQKEIQPHMQFTKNKSLSLFNKTQLKQSETNYTLNLKSNSLKSLKLPSISSLMLNPEKKTYFKAVEEMGNSLKSMHQSQSDRIRLQNRLMIAMDDKQAHIQSMVMELLIKSNYWKKKANSERNLKSFKSLQLNI